MARKKNIGPTEKELQILSILWKNGPSTVREINSKINQSERRRLYNYSKINADYV